MNRRLITRRELTLGFTASAAGCTPSLSAPEQPRSAAPAAATTPSVPAQRSLDELLAYNRTRDPEYDGSLSNHLSMALGALAKLGATDARLTAFAERYETEPLRARSPLASPDFRASLGTRAAFVALAEQFEAACRERGRHALLGEVLPEVLPGLAGGAFHGLIRSAYALDAEDDAELAHGLAYFVTVAAPFPALPAPRADASTGARELADRALADPRLDKGTFGAVITPALRAAASQPGFDDYMAALRTGPETLDELARERPFCSAALGFGAMSDALRDLRVLALDAQASGATPAYGDVIELGWGICSARGQVAPARSRWLIPRTRRPVGRAVRELTGWSEAVLAEAVGEAEAWSELGSELAGSFGAAGGIPTVIHFARFEAPFLRDLFERLGGAPEYPFDTVCLHAIATRFLPDLPRRSIRALAGYFGHSPELVRRSSGHVEATAFIWQGLVPLLEAAGVGTWSELKLWLAEAAPSTRSTRRAFPLAAERRRALPDTPGVYRFLRPNGQVVYVGKAVSLKKRVASHFKSRGPATERSLELLSQVHAIEHTETESLLEAALLETDEIKRLDPPYNVQLRSGERSAWFCARDFRSAQPAPDAAHPVGPLPSERALSGLPALIALAGGAEPSAPLLAAALAVPAAFLPDRALFDEGFRTFAAEHLSRPEPTTPRRVTAGALTLWLARGRTELESALETAPGEWDLARVRRRLERTLVQGGLLLRRARLLALLADADVAFREASHAKARALVIATARLVARKELEDIAELDALPLRRPPSLRARQSAFDAAAYDRLRVLLTELRRIFDEGGEVALRFGRHRLAGEKLARLLRSI